MTTRPQAPAVPVEEEALFRVIGWGFTLLGRMLRYWFRRARQDWLVGLVYLLTWPPAVALLVQNARQALAVALAPAYAAPERFWPLAGQPLPWEGLALVACGLLLTWILDRRRARAAARRAAQIPVATRPLQYDVAEWVAGWVVERTWNPDPGDWVTQPTRDLFTLTADHLRVNLLVVAPQGGGKTSMILNPVLHLCRRSGAACLVFNVKGDPEDPREPPDFDPHEFHVTFDLAHPEHSVKLNIAADGTPREVGEQLGEALIYDPGANKAYFVNNAKDALGGLFAAHHGAYGTIPSFREILAYLRDPRQRDDLLGDLRKAGRPADSDEVLDLQRINQLLTGKNDALGDLDLALAPLARGAVADLLVTDDSGLRIADLLRQGARVHLILPVYRQPRVAPIIGRLVLAQFTNAVLDPHCNKTLLKVAIVDEAHWFITPSMPPGMAQARANFGSYVLALQDLPQIRDEPLREQIWAVATNRIVLPGVGDHDQDKFSRTWAARERLYIQRSTSQSTSQNTSRSQGRGQHSGSLIGGGVTGGGSTQMNTMRSASVNEGQGERHQTRLRADWLPAEIRGLPEHHAVIERRDAYGHMTAPTLVALDRRMLDQVLIRQDLRLYQQIGRRDASTFQPREPHPVGPPSTPVHPPAAPPPALPLAGPTQANAAGAASAAKPAGGVTVSYSRLPVEPAPAEPGTQASPATVAAGASGGVDDDAITAPGSTSRPTPPEELSRREPLPAAAVPDPPPRTQASPRPGSAARTRASEPASPAATPGWEAAAVAIITERLPLDVQTAEALVAIARQNGRGPGYLTELIDYIHAQPNIVLPGKAFQRLVETNQDRRRRGSRIPAPRATPTPQE